MAIICPTILADNPHSYRTQIERVGFAKRLHLDFTDGEFAASRTLSLQQAWWPSGVKADIHLMYKNPMEVLDQLIALKPRSVILHAEAGGDFKEIYSKLRAAKIKISLALLAGTPVSLISPAINSIDGVLIFSGNLGQFGGTADLKLIDKVEEIAHKWPALEVGWDGGINDQNASALVAAGVDVLNVGGYIQRAEDPKNAYDTLLIAVGDKNNHEN